MDLALNSRFVSLVLRVGDARKMVDDDDELAELIDATGGDFDIAGEFGFRSTGDDEDG